MEEWTAFISKEGLSGIIHTQFISVETSHQDNYYFLIFLWSMFAVIDVYSAWCGPCKAVQGLFRRIKNEVGDDLLRFSLVRKNKKVGNFICITFF